VLQKKQVLEQENRSDILLRSMLPEELLLELGKGRHVDESKLMTDFSEVTVIFFKLCDFQIRVKMLRPDQVVHVLSSIWTKFDSIVDLHSTYKVETVGEEYLIASGCTGSEIINHAQLCVNTALHMLDACNKMMKRGGEEQNLRKLVPNLAVRLGVHTGPLVAGLVGMRFKLIGDTVNTASRMQSTSQSGRIQISLQTHQKLVAAGETNCPYAFEKRAPFQVKGKGLMQTFFLTGRKGNDQKVGDVVIEKPAFRRSVDATRRGSLDSYVHNDKVSLQQAKLGDCAVQLLQLKSPRAKELRDCIQAKLLPCAGSTQTQMNSLPVIQAIWLGLGYGNFSKAANVEDRESVANEALYQANQFDRALAIYRYACVMAIVIFNAVPAIWVFGFYPDSVDPQLARIWLITHSGVITPFVLIFLRFTYTKNFAINIQQRNLVSVALLFVAGCGILFMVKCMHHLEVLETSTNSSSQGVAKIPVDIGGLALFIIFVFHFRMISMLARSMLTIILTVLYMGTQRFGSEEQNSMRSGFVLLCFSLGQMIASFLQEYTERLSFNSMITNKVQKTLLEAAELRNDRLLRLRLPPQIVYRLKQGQQIADHFACVTILQTDVVGFTSFSSTVTPYQLRQFVDAMFYRFNAIVDRHGMYTVEIIGDAFLVVSGCPSLHTTHAAKACAAALEFNETLEKLSVELPSIIGISQGESATAARNLTIRLGLHSGPIVAGVVGVKDPRYHIFGETVHIAQGMESQGEAGRVQCTQETYDSVMNAQPQENFGGRFIMRPTYDLKASPKYDGTYTKQTYFVENVAAEKSAYAR